MHRTRLAALVLALAGATSVAARDAAAHVDGPADACAVAGTEGGAASRGVRRIAGKATRVRDGDTIEVCGEAVRLWGAHAPELRQPGGQAARRWMVERIAGQVVVCHLAGRRSHGRLVAVCHDRDGDLAAQLIQAGLGRDCPRFSLGRYAALETDSGRALALPVYCRARPPSGAGDRGTGGRPPPAP